MTTSLRRALFALALGCALPLSAPQSWAAPANVAPEIATLRAKVSDAAGAPIEGAEILVVRRGANEEVRTTSLKTDARGQIELSRPESQFAVQVFAYKAGLALQRAYLFPDKDIAITLKTGATATGKVVDADGKPVAGARVELTRLLLGSDDEADIRLRNVSLKDVNDSALERAFAVQTNANGIWEMGDLPVGSIGYFQLNDARFVRDEKFGTPTKTSQIVPDLTATAGANLKGRVINPDGKPVAGARINIEVDEKNSRSKYANTVTAKDGTYSLASLPAGEAKIQVNSPDAALAPTNIKGVKIVTGQTATAPEIRLNAGVLLTGKVLDEASKKPVEGASVMAAGDFGNATSTKTGVDGTYQVRVPTGQIRFYVYERPAEYVRDMFADANADITTASANAPDFAIARGLTLTGTARDETGAPAVDAQIIAGSSWDGAQTSVDAQGKWTLKGVNAKSNGRRNAAQKGRLKTNGDWQIVGDGMVSLREGDEIKLTLQRIERKDVTLRVVTPEGEPVEGAKVRFDIMFDIAFDSTGRPTGYSTRYEDAVSNERGEVTVKKLRPDESAKATPTKEGYELQKAGVITTLDDDKNGKTRTTDAILAPKNGVLRGRIVDADGVAAVGARVAVLWPGDLRNEKSFIESDANGNFALDNLRAGEVIVGAARGREFGQIETQTGGEIEIKLIAGAAQPAPENRVMAREMLEEWFASAKQNDDKTLANYAASIAGVGGLASENLVARSENGKLWFELEQTPASDKAQAARALRAARAAADEPKKPDEHQSALLDLAALLVQNGDVKEAREIYDSVAPTITIPRGVDPQKAMWDAYKYAKLAGIAGAIEHPNADYWLELLDLSLDQMKADDRLFRIGSYAKTLAEIDARGVENWLETRSSAERVRSYEDVIPVVAARDLGRAQQMLAKMDELVARGDIPIEPDRNDAMYRPKPMRSLNVARTAIVEGLMPIDPSAAYKEAQKINNNDGYVLENLQIETALRLPNEQLLPILRAQFEEAQNKSNRSAGSMAKLAKLAAPLDAKLSDQWFDMARQKLTDNKSWNDNTREMAANYAFYHAEKSPAQSRLLLENEWQRTLNTKVDEIYAYARAGRLRYLVWAMAPLDWERALQMMRESDKLLGKQYMHDMITQYNLATWLLSSEQERREMDFDKPRARLFK